MAYIGLFIQIHDLEKDIDEKLVCDTVRDVLNHGLFAEDSPLIDRFGNRFANSIIVTIEEHVGVTCHDVDHDIKESVIKTEVL